jgi:ADP-heptose:LPS heptosyltransferase
MTRAAQVIRISPVKRLASFCLALVAFGLRVMRRLTTRRPRGRAGSVLILEPFGMGDVVTHEPLVRALEAHGCDITFCARPEFRVLFPELKWIDSAIAWGLHARGAKYPFQAYLSPAFRQFFGELRAAARGSVGVDTRGDIRSVLLLYLAGCRQVLTLSNYLGSDLAVPRFAASRIPFSPELRRWESNVLFAQPFGDELEGISPPSFPHLQIPSEDSWDRVALIAVAPWKGKWWLPERWQAVVASLRARHVSCTGLCGPGQTPLAQEQLGDGVPIMECGTIEEWARELQNYSYVITLDTGPMHLADALGLPVIALFGQGLLPLWAPSHPGSIVVMHQDDADFRVCAPIEANTASGEEFMHRIKVEEVLAAAERLPATAVRGP